MEPKPTILILNGSLPPPFGGVATFLADALPYLVEKGFEVHTLFETGPRDRHERFRKQGVHVHDVRLGRLGTLVSSSRLFLQINAALRSLGVQWSSLKPSLKSTLMWIAAGDRLASRISPHLVHAYDSPWSQGFAASLLARKYHTPYLQTIFGEIVPHSQELDHHDALGDKLKGFVGKVLQQSDLIMSVSRHCAREVSYVGLDPASVAVTYYGIHIARFKDAGPSDRLRSELDLIGKQVLLFVGHIRPRKGPQVLIDALPLVMRQCPAACAVFVGPDFDMVDELKHRARTLGVLSSTRFVGPVDEASLPAYYHLADAFVFPSLTAIECLGLSSVQAMASSRPVIGSRIDGVPEVVIDGETGFLVEPNNPAVLADKGVMLLRDPALRRRMGEAGYRRATEHFEQDTHLRRLEEIYRSFVNPQSGSPSR